MWRLFYRVIRYIQTHKCYVCFLIVWFWFTYILLADRRARGPNQVGRFIRDHHGSSNFGRNSSDCICTCNPYPKSTENPKPVAQPWGKLGVKYTLPEFTTRAKSDPSFLKKLLDQNFLHKDSKEVIRCFLTDTKYDGFDSEVHEPVKFQRNYNIYADTIVFLHVQKTGGSYFNERVKKLSLPFPCNCHVVPCLSCRPGNGTVWLYTWAVTGWKCGLHADWTQMHRCMPDLIDRLEGKHRQRRYFYITQLRNPVDRYLSEWKHQFRGNHWQDATLGCGRGVADWMDVRPCFIGESWMGVPLDDFMACPHNMATNRQARMLADLNLTNCYREYTKYEMQVKRAYSWVKSAIYNLKHMEYFGILEEQETSDKLFQKTFNLELRKHQAFGKAYSTPVTEEQFKRVLKLVELDVHVYMFAKELFSRRAKH